MSSIFPLRDTVTQDEQGGPRLLDLDDDTADEVFEALAAGTTREIFLALHEQPQTASDLADRTDTSVQNVQYHLGKLEDVELIESVDTWYSERGSEMDVYAPTDESLVLFAGQDKERSIRSIFNRIVGVASVLAPSSLLVAWAASRTHSGSDSTSVDSQGGESIDVQTVDPAPQPSSSDDVGIATEDTGGNETAFDPEETDVMVEENLTDSPLLVTDGGNATQVPDDAVSSSADILGLDPALAVGLAFFLGGLFVVTALWLWYGTPE
jgi:DNA-binding transcriptional ArsR family regulator